MNNLQLVLSGFKGATDISVHLGEDPDYLYVYLGLALLERVPNNPDELLYQLMLARLVNSGASLRLLASQFNHAPKTLKSWAAAVLSGDMEEIITAFSGRGPSLRMTATIRSFAKGQYLAIRHIHVDYRKRIRQAIAEKYNEEFSEGFLSRLFFEFDAESRELSALTDEPTISLGKIEPIDTTKSQPSVSANEPTTDVSEIEPINTTRSQAELSSASESEEGVTYSSAPVRVDPEPDTESVNTFEAYRLPLSGMQLPDKPLLVHHAGQIIFSPWIDLATHDYPPEFQMQKQWMGQILQGAVNIEQSKAIAASDISMFVGPVRPNHDSQRRGLDAMATPETFHEILLRNSRLISDDGPCLGNVFYYDPHGKEYTGAETILKGWCGSRHGISKMLYLDIVHTRSGDPCYIYHADNYYDMRERFFLMLYLFNALFPSQFPRTWIIDRGIFGLLTFDAFMLSGDYFITWEKGYNHDGWDESKPFKSFRRCRERNKRGDIRVWHFDCQEHPWSKNTRIRRIIARATNPNGNTVEVAILCSNPDMSVEDILTLIFNRWIQENDFGYLDRHFGMCEITSYATQTYREIEHTLRDRNVDCPEFSQLKSQQRKAETELKRELLKREKKEDVISKLKAEETKLNSRREALLNKAQQQADKVDLNKTGRNSQLNAARKHAEKEKIISRELKALQKRIASHMKTLEKIRAAIKQLKETHAEILQKIDSTLRDDSRLKLLVMDNFNRLDMRKKAIMDAIKLTSRNIFYCAAELFRPIYDNHRDDHVILRLLSRASGLIKINRQRCRIEIKLWLEGTLQQNQKDKINEFLKVITLGINQHFSGRATAVEISLLEEGTLGIGAHLPDHTL